MRLLEQTIGKPGTMFLSNIRDEAGLENFKALGKYKLRMLSMLHGDVTATVPCSIKREVQELFQYYDQLGIPHLTLEQIHFLPETQSEPLLSDHLLQQDVGKLLEGRKYLEPFIHSENTDTIAAFGVQTSRTNQASETINNKAIAQKELRALGVPTPLGFNVRSLKDVDRALERLKHEGYKRVGVKVPRSASAMGVAALPIDDVYANIAEHHVQHLSSPEGMLLDGWVEDEVVHSPNIQFYVGKTPADDILISCSDQILSDKSEHQGNISMPELLNDVPGLRDTCRIVCNWIRSKGGYGINGLDFIITKKGDELEHCFMEDNGRVNGSTNAAIMTDTLHPHNNVAWGVNNTIGVSRSLTLNDLCLTLEQEGIAYSPDTKTGVIIANHSAIETFGKAMVVSIGDNQAMVRHHMEVLSSLKEGLPV